MQTPLGRVTRSPPTKTCPTAPVRRQIRDKVGRIATHEGRVEGIRRRQAGGQPHAQRYPLKNTHVDAEEPVIEIAPGQPFPRSIRPGRLKAGRLTTDQTASVPNIAQRAVSRRSMPMRRSCRSLIESSACQRW